MLSLPMRGLPLLLLATLGATAFAEQRPVGKIVRIERSARPKTIPIFCMGDQRGGSSDKGRCFGVAKPALGDVVQFVDETHLKLELRIASVETIPSCEVGYVVTYTGDVQTLVENTQLGGIIGAGITPRGKRLEMGTSIPDAPDEQLVLSLDRDGTGEPDFAVSYAACDKQGLPAKNAYEDICLFTYNVEAGKWSKTSSLPGLMKCMQNF